MTETERDALRYRALSEWMRSGQPAGRNDRMAGEMLELAQKRKTWPIPQDIFDAAVDRAMKPNACYPTFVP
jgi:hypothetical protein